MTVECTVHDQCTGLRMYTVSYTAFGCSQDGRCVSVSTDISAVCNVPITTMSCTTSGCNGGNSTQATPIPSEGSWSNSARGLAVRRQTVAYALMFAAAMAVDCGINYGTYMDISRAWPCLHRMLSLYIAGSDPEPRLHSNLDPARGIRPGSDRSREVDQIPGSDPDRPRVYTCL